MRKKLISAIFVIAMAAILVGCNKGDESQEVSPYITIDAGVGSLTRATSTAFETNDKVSIYAWTGSNTVVQTPLVVNNALNTYDGTKWTAVPQMLWKDNTTPHYFIGAYPVKAITDFTADTYTTTPDLLVATVLGEGRIATAGIVPLVFDHVMARLDVNLTFRSEFGTTTPTVESVTTTAQPGATVNYLTKVATADGTAASVSLASTTASKAYTAIIAPQTGVNKIVIRIAGKDYTYTHGTDISLEKGKYTTVNLIVGRDAITLGNVTINEWAAGETIPDGEATN